MRSGLNFRHALDPISVRFVAYHLPQAVNRVKLSEHGGYWWSNNFSHVFYAGKCLVALESPDSWAISLIAEVPAALAKK